MQDTKVVAVKMVPDILDRFAVGQIVIDVCSTVRLAKSNADMWVPILTQNRENVLRVMDTYIEKMEEFREAIAGYDEDKIRELIHAANRIKRILR